MSRNPNTVTFPDVRTLPPSYFTADRGHILKGVSIAFIVLEVLAFGLRAHARRIKRVAFGWDDVIMIPALLCNLALCIISYVSVPYAGVGHHTIVALQMGMDKLVFLGKSALLISPIMYTLAVSFSKGAILYLYVRIFPRGPARYITYAIAAIIVLHSSISILITLFQCNPISLLWAIDRTGCKVNMELSFQWNSIPHIITDVLMFILPMPQIWALNTSLRMKIGLSITFVTASVGIVTSILRTVAFFKAEIFSDPAWVAVPLYAYTIAEPGTYLLAACFSTYRPLLRYFSKDSVFSRLTSRYFRSSFFSTRGRSLKADEEDGNVRTTHIAIAAPKKARGFNSILLSDLSSNVKSDARSDEEHII